MGTTQQQVDGHELVAMRRAVHLSRRVLGATSPNPPVGAVVLDADGAIVGTGATQPPGGPHAEVVALAKAGEAARGGTLVVTLEPCDHTGRTGPCTRAVLDAGVTRVLIAVADPTALAGGGAATLSAAGVQVVTGVLADEVAAGPLHGWLHAAATGRPHVTWKYAATLDGRSAAADGTSQWITGQEAREDVHRLRAGMDAIMAGVGTVLADDPSLTTRQAGAPHPRQPVRVVVDSHRRAPAASRVFDAQALTWWCGVDEPAAGDDRPHPRATAVTVDAGPDGRVDPASLLVELYEAGVVTVLLEGGPTLAASMLSAGLVDRVVAYLAPALLGSGAAAVGDLGVGSIGGIRRLHLQEVVRLGDDVRLTLTPFQNPNRSTPEEH